MTMKLKFILVLLLALNGSGKVLAETSNTLPIVNGLQTELTQANSQVWPVLPGESLNDIARLFYPQNVVMQRLFISKTLRLNMGKQANLNATARFKEPILLVIPTLKSLSRNTQVTQPTAEKPAKHQLQITTDIERVLDSVPSELKEEYEFWVSKNELLKQQLAILKDKIVFLETKLNGLKLIWEKTLSLPAGDSAAINAGTNGVTAETNANNSTEIASNTTNAINSAAGAVVTSAGSGKKVFKNLNAKPTSSPVAPKITALKSSKDVLDYLNMDWVKAALALGLLAILSVFALKKYRAYMFAKMSFATTKMHTSIQETMVDFGGYLKPKTLEESPEVKLQAKAAKDAEARLDSTLAEAKLLMSVNRHQDAIAHLKLTIEAQPKACINHWLYLLEIYRKLDLKDEFEAHATGLHQIYNVMTPVWYDTKVAMVVPQSLEEFPHIMEKLYTVWPGHLAGAYLRGLIADNRGGERVGFGKAVLREILMLIEILDIQKELN